MTAEDGEGFIKNLAQFVRTHERALANALQLRRQEPSSTTSLKSLTTRESPIDFTDIVTAPAATTTTASALAAAFSLANLSFTSQHVKPQKLSLTPHHLFYLLSRFEELGIVVGPMNVRLENLHAGSTSNYVSFLDQSRQPQGRRGSDQDSIRSVSSIRSVMSGMSSLWSNLGLGTTMSAARAERQQMSIQADLKYLYASFTKIPCLKLCPDRRARLIKGYEEFPFDTAVPLHAFKNVSALEVSDLDVRHFFGWDRMADQLRTLSVKKGAIDDPLDLLVSLVLDDMDKRRRRSSKAQHSPVNTWGPSTPKYSPTLPNSGFIKSSSMPESPQIGPHLEEHVHFRQADMPRSGSSDALGSLERSIRSASPSRPKSSRAHSSYSHIRGSNKMKRSGSASSTNSEDWSNLRGSSTSLSSSALPTSKWRFLRHLGLADNDLTTVSAASLVPLTGGLHSLDLSGNLFAQIPDSLASLTALRSLNLSGCMIDSLHSLKHSPLPAITALNLRGNHLKSLAGVERLYPLERLDLRDNNLTDPAELARLTGIPDLKEIWVAGNPFCSTHDNYRVTIFNLFRNTPGYNEDITIDATGPGYSERRNLVDRVPERPHTAVIQHAEPIEVSNPSPEPIFLPSEPASVEIGPRKERSVVTRPDSYTRRKKTSKRRIVDLSTTEISPISIDTSDMVTGPAIPPIPIAIVSGEAAPMSGAKAADDQERLDLHPLDNTCPNLKRGTTFPMTDLQELNPPPRRASQHAIAADGHLSIASDFPKPSHDELPVIKQDEDWNMSGELYRRRIEALRSEVGDNWLGVLEEEGWQEVGKNSNGQTGVVAVDGNGISMGLNGRAEKSLGLSMSGKAGKDVDAVV